MTQDTSIYYVWIGGSCDYGHKERAGGAADSETGTVPINDSLSASRANYIYNELVKRGIDGSRINNVSEGGIDDYKPTEANRQTKVCLYYL